MTALKQRGQGVVIEYLLRVYTLCDQHERRNDNENRNRTTTQGNEEKRAHSERAEKQTAKLTASEYHNTEEIQSCK